MKTLNLGNIIWKKGEHYIAQCLNVDVSSFGKSKEEAMNNLQEALELYFEDNSAISNITVIEQAEVVDSVISYG